jgi:rhodanese-related sulfurtransferase
VAENAAKISLDKKVVIHCRSGKRSGDAIRLLESRFGFQNLYNLAGGILAWSDQVDTSMAKY